MLPETKQCREAWLEGGSRNFNTTIRGRDVEEAVKNGRTSQSSDVSTASVKTLPTHGGCACSSSHVGLYQVWAVRNAGLVETLTDALHNVQVYMGAGGRGSRT